jgi:ABC-type nitrate/sulfonate/bicarbonate transport system substrate-binding protein
VTVIGLNRLKTKRTLSGFILTAIAILLIILFSLRKGTVKNLPVDNEGDLLSHPIYSKYIFNNTDKVINIGVQPLYSPTGLISEAMKRDVVLQKALKGLGMEIRYFPFLKGDDVNFFLKNMALDIGIGGDMPAISAAAAMDILVPVILQRGFTSIVATRSMLTSQLQGKRIAFPFGSIAHYVILDALASEGFSESQADLIPMDALDMADALSRKKIDAFAVWEPATAIALKEHPSFVTIYQQMTTGYMYFLKGFYEKHPEAARHIVAAVGRAFQWMMGNRQNLFLAGKWAKEAGERLGAQKIPFTSKEIADLAQKDVFGLTSVPVISGDDLAHNGPLHRELRFLKTLGRIPPSVTWDRIRSSFDRQMVPKILADSIKYDLNRFDYHQDSTNRENGAKQ